MTHLSQFTLAGAATRYLLLKRGVVSNTKISAIEEEILQGEPVVKVESAERHHAMVNFGAPRFLVCWEPYSGCGPAGHPAAAQW